MLLYLSLCVYYIYLYVSILLTRSFFFVFAEEKNFEFVYYLNVPLEKRFERRKHCETKHVISYFVNKKNKKGRNVDSLFNTWMFHTNVIRRIHDMYKKKAEKKKESHLPTNLFFSSIPDNMNSSAVSFHICPRHMRIEIIDKREYNNLYTVIFFFLPFFLV